MISTINLYLWIYIWIISFSQIEVSHNQPRLPKCAHWSVNGIKVASKTTIGIYPLTLFIDKNNTFFVVNNNDRNVKEWRTDNINVTRTTFKDLNESRSIFVTNDKTIYVDNGNNGKVEKWTLNATKSEIVMKISSACYGLFVDFMNNLYCSLENENQVIKQSLQYNNENTSKTIIIGNGICGQNHTMLCGPHGIFVTDNLDLYVADCGNNRIQLFKSEQIIGETIVGDIETSNIRLYCPLSVFVDADNQLFILDFGNQRIIRSNSNGFYCIIGCLNIDGSLTNGLELTSVAAFDSYGNIFVVSSLINQIQKFILLTDFTDPTPSIIQSIYSSVLTENSPKYSPDECQIMNHYYETIEIKVSSDGCYDFINQSNRNIIIYMYQNEFDVFNPKLNLLVHTRNNFEIYLKATIKYVLVVTTYLPNIIGNFSIFVFGPSEVNFNQIKTPSVIVQATYTSKLTTNSTKYFKDSYESIFYYETIQVNVIKDDFYIFSHNSDINIVNFIYINQFNPFNPSLNKIRSTGSISGCENAFTSILPLEKRYTYILVITTSDPYVTGSFSILARGPNKIILKPINTSSIIVQATYSSELRINSPKFLLNSIEPDFYYEAIQINVMENSTYAFSVNCTAHMQAFFYKHTFDPFNPSLNEILATSGDQFGNQFQMIIDFYKETTYILVITTLIPKMIGFFSVTVFGFNLVTLKYMNSSSVILQTKYSSILSNNSSKYPENCIESNYYYEAFQVNVFEDGTYVFVIDTMGYMHGYMYRHKFDPLNPSLNQIHQENRVVLEQRNGLRAYLQTETLYIYVVTTAISNRIGSFSIIVFGPSNITLKRINTSSVVTEPIYWLEISTNPAIYYPVGIGYINYYEAIQVHIVEDGIYAFSCGGTLDTHGYIYEDEFNPFNPYINQMKKADFVTCENQFKLTANLQKTKTYIFIVSTKQIIYPSKLFPIFIIGPSNVTLKRMNSSSVNSKAIYTSELHTNSQKYSGPCIELQYYYEAIQINVIENGFYTFGIDRNIYVHVSIYKDKFNPLHSFLNRLKTYNDIHIINFDSTNLFIADLQKETTYILIVSTLKSFTTGPFSITVLGPNNITLTHTNISTEIVLTTYSSELTINSSKYSWDCIVSNYYYEALEFNIVEDGFYTIGSKSKMMMCGFIYKDKFNIYDPSINIIKEDCASGCNDSFKIITYLETKIKYILIVTTFEEDETDSFSVIILGPNNATLKRTDEKKDSCFVGTICRFYEKTIGLTLDDLLRDNIRWNTTLNNQSITIKICTALTIIMFIGGLINSILSLITFQNTQLRNVGCGIYLFASSITSLITITMFTVKFWFFILTHMAISMNVSTMLWSCKSIEPILKLFLYLDAWLNACVAVERAINVSNGVTFNRVKSKRIARRIIMILPICVALTLIHEPIKRDVFEFQTDKHKTTRNTRTNYIYCITRYSTSLETYNTIILFVHLLIPFFINIFSALYIIFGVARQRSTAQPGRTYKQHVQEQFNEHKQLLISPLVLSVLSSPRVAIALLPGCVNVSRNLWLYLSAYFISFIPSMLIFIIFVLPSKLYTKQFKDTLVAWQQRRPRQ